MRRACHTTGLVCCLYLLAVSAAAQTNDLVSTTPVAMSAEDRVQRYLYRTYSWQRMSLLAVDTVVDSMLFKPDFGRSAGGISCHYASRFGRRVVGNSIEYGMAEVMQEDLRYRPSGQHLLPSRLRHAALQAFTAYRPDGSRELAYARFAGYTGRALVSSTWCPHPLTLSRTSQDVGFGLLDQVQNNLLSEFSPDLKRFGVRVRKSLFRR